jgi:phosphatidylglycerophosphate synthase
MYSLKEIFNSLPPEKIKEDGIWTHFVLRPLSYPVSWLALRMKLSPTFVTFFSAVLSVAGGILFSLPFPICAGIGVILFNIFSVLDCVDGNMARVSGRAGPWGGWADAVMGFVTYTSVFFATGLWIFWKTEWWPVLLITGFTSSANLLARVAYQIYKNIERESAHSSVSFERKLAENVGITGFMMPLLVVFHFCDFLPGMWFIVYFNAAFYSGGCFLTLLKLGRKAIKN